MSTNPMQLPLTPHDAATAQRIVEFVFPGEARQQWSLILPVLGHLTNNGDPRWLTCIGPQLLAKKDCRRYQLNWQRLLQVLPNQKCAVIDLAERALQAGKSHTVVCVVGELNAAHLARLERAAAIGNCQGIVIRSR
jgi:cell division inhibitor SulA